IKALIGRIARGEEVPPGLDCTLRGEQQPNHLMYKAKPLHHPSGNATYEFLVEYDRMEPNVGIYLGCKCITNPEADHRKMIDVYVNEWNTLRRHVCTVLNNSFPTKEFRHRFRLTNNGENHTFWPSWIALYDDEDMEFALTVLRILRKAYEQFFNGTLKNCRPLPPIDFHHIPASFTESAFVDLRNAISGLYGKDKITAAAEMFDRFILNASGQGIFTLDPSYDLAWRYVGKPEIGLTGSNIEFSTIMHLLPYEIARRLGVKNLKINTPWGHLMKVFLDSEGVAFKSGTRSQWQNVLDDTKDICGKMVNAWLDNE
ncbi:MAG: hypothetical protein K2G69_01565, partial [Muribaculaceae bacterium]|nr:hypothetical protein [Muribaculaceae bacterium]